jgi:hypothetical protein
MRRHKFVTTYLAILVLYRYVRTIKCCWQFIAKAGSLSPTNDSLTQAN